MSIREDTELGESFTGATSLGMVEDDGLAASTRVRGGTTRASIGGWAAVANMILIAASGTYSIGAFFELGPMIFALFDAVAVAQDFLF